MSAAGRARTCAVLGAVLGVVLLAACRGSSQARVEPVDAPPGEPEASGPADAPPAEDERVEATLARAGGDLSGADCEIWIAPTPEHRLKVSFSSATDPSTPDPLQLHVVPAQGRYCVGGEEVRQGRSRTLVLKVAAGGAVQELYFDASANVVTASSSGASALGPTSPVVFASNVDADERSFDLNIHYARAMVVLHCESGNCP